MKKRGFTLIELLAVIVVLAIIALIATPMVLNTIEKSKQGAASSSAYTYLNEVETKLATYMLKHGGVSYNTGKHTVSELQEDLKVEVKGDIPSVGNICIGENGTVTKASLKINNYVISYDGRKAITTDLEEIENIICTESSEEVALVPKYFAFESPTTSSTTDYTTLGKNVFATLYSDGNTRGVCINDDNYFDCDFNGLGFTAEPNGDVRGDDYFGDAYCYAFASGSASCTGD